MRENAVVLENFSRAVIEFRGEKTCHTRDPRVRGFGNDDVVLLPCGVHVIAGIIKDEVYFRIFITAAIHVSEPPGSAHDCRLDLNAVDVFDFLECCNRSNGNPGSITNHQSRLRSRMVKSRKEPDGELRHHVAAIGGIDFAIGS